MSNNLFLPVAIDECFSNEGIYEGIKDDLGKWSVHGHKNRLLHITIDDLGLFSKVFDEDKNAINGPKLPVLHSNTFLKILEKFGELSSVTEDLCQIYASEMWHETNNQKDKTIKRMEHTPSEAVRCILSGPNIGECNMYSKIPRINCSSKGDYDLFSLHNLKENEEYLPRVLFTIGESFDSYYGKIGTTSWGTKHIDEYRLALKTMLSNTSEFNLKATIVPPGVSHIQSIITFAFADPMIMLYICGLLSSIPYLFFFRITGKRKFSRNTINMFPVSSNKKQYNRIVGRVLLLNSVSKAYQTLWNKVGPSLGEDNWMFEGDPLLDKSVFGLLKQDWNGSCIVCNDYQRHELFAELDVLIAKMLGLSLDELIEIYRSMFPNFLQSEDNTYYDSNGRIIFTTNRSYSGSYTLSSQEWENVKGNSDGSASKQYIESFNDIKEERNVTFTPPYRKIDRIKLYQDIWDK